jgi:hypothetical protein
MMRRELPDLWARRQRSRRVARSTAGLSAWMPGGRGMSFPSTAACPPRLVGNVGGTSSRAKAALHHPQRLEDFLLKHGLPRDAGRVRPSPVKRPMSLTANMPPSGSPLMDNFSASGSLNREG